MSIQVRRINLTLLGRLYTFPGLPLVVRQGQVLAFQAAPSHLRVSIDGGAPEMLPIIYGVDG